MNETEILFTEMLNCNRLSLYLNKNRILDKHDSTLVLSILKRRILGEPLQYILGKTEFMGLEFKVTPDVFIPRPETEILVETVIKLVSKYQSTKVSSINILDLGTGSGCIAVSLAKFLSNVKIYATDISKEAIEVAGDNALLNNVTDKIKFIHSDLFTSYELQVNRYDIIVSNPPYIPTEEIEALQPEIRYEPRLALDGGRDGLDFYRKIIGKAPFYLKQNGYAWRNHPEILTTGGFLILEIGFKQKDAIKNIFQMSGNFEIIEIIKDYNNIDRIIVAQNKPPHL